MLVTCRSPLTLVGNFHVANERGNTMIDTAEVRRRWGLGEVSDVEALTQLCYNHLTGCKVAFFVISDVVVYMAEREAKKL